MSRSPTQLFVATVTGQNVANFPPILECAHPGDKVLWLESPQAARLDWRTAALDVLRNAQLEMLPPCSIPAEANLSAWQKQLHSSVLQCRQQGWRPVLVLNGGHKLMALILVDIWRKLQPTLVHGYDRPAALWLAGADLTGAAQMRPYTRHHLDLQEILILNHYQICSTTTPVCIWSSVQPQNISVSASTDPNDSATLVEELAAPRPVPGQWQPLFGCIRETALREAVAQRIPESWRRNVQNFVTAHRQHPQLFENLYHAALHVLKAIPLTKNLDFAYYDEMAHLVGTTKLKQWMAHLWGAVPRKSAKEKEQSKAPKSKSGLLTELFMEVCKQVHVMFIPPSSVPSDLPPPTTEGGQFERKVAERVVAFVENSPAKHIVQSIYAGVKVSPLREPHTVAAEFDVLLVLKNAILIHIECKTGGWVRKDLDARLTNLRRMGSSIAVLAICTPLFTSARGSNLMRSHSTRVEIESIPDMRYLPYTEPDQPRHYTVYDENGEERTYEVETFEEALARLLQPYMLSNAAKG
jgi:hypothetical protein